MFCDEPESPEVQIDGRCCTVKSERRFSESGISLASPAEDFQLPFSGFLPSYLNLRPLLENNAQCFNIHKKLHVYFLCCLPVRDDGERWESERSSSVTPTTFFPVEYESFRREPSLNDASVRRVGPWEVGHGCVWSTIFKKKKLKKLLWKINTDKAFCENAAFSSRVLEFLYSI